MTQVSVPPSAGLTSSTEKKAGVTARIGTVSVRSAVRMSFKPLGGAAAAIAGPSVSLQMANSSPGT